MRRSNTSKGALFFIISLLAAGLLLALPRPAGAQDPPGRVARLNFIQGSVSMQPAGTQDWFDANPNRPLTTGDNLWSGDDGRGELHVGGAALRLSNDTGISFLNLTDTAVQIQLAQGNLDVRLRRLGDDEAYEVDTPNLAFTLLRPGEYRISVDPNGNSTAITVRSGSGEVTGGGSAYNLDPGQQGIFSGTSPLSFDNEYAPPYDDFDNWCLARDRREDQSASARYISRDVIGYEDLDMYGTWRADPVYGNVWVPTGVAFGWAPYHHGHWAYVAPWGWTWVDDQPWGFAPFHYGRWAYASGAWVWVPGSVAVVVGHPYVRPMYAPALVAFVGGGGFSVSISLGGGVAGMAWFPLGPRDVWVPSYHCSPAYVQNVNISNSTVINRTQITNVYNTTTVTNVTNITYMNQSAPGAVTAVSKEAFTSGKPVATAAVRVSPEQIQHPQVIERTAPPAPRNLAPATAVRASVRPPAALATRPLVTKMKPSPQVVPIGHKEMIARSNLVRPAPPAPPAKKLPPPAPGGRPATAATPGRPVMPAVKPGAPQPPSRTVTPPTQGGMPAPSKAITPPPSKAATPPQIRPVTPPTQGGMPAPSKAAKPAEIRPVTPPSKAVTPPPSRPFTPPPRKEVTPPPKATTPPPSKAATPASKEVKPAPSKPAKEEPKRKPEP
jgi:hypothetical protein